MKALEKYVSWFPFSQCECILDFITGTGSSSTLLVCRYVGLFGFLEKAGKHLIFVLGFSEGIWDSELNIKLLNLN